MDEVSLNLSPTLYIFCIRNPGIDPQAYTQQEKCHYGSQLPRIKYIIDNSMLSEKSVIIFKHIAKKRLKKHTWLVNERGRQPCREVVRLPITLYKGEASSLLF
jgi:hypothetical protein